jgi:hypothetical protein
MVSGGGIGKLSLQGAVSQRNVKLTYRFESCPDHNELITQMDSSILKDGDILLGARQERYLKFGFNDIKNRARKATYFVRFNQP